MTMNPPVKTIEAYPPFLRSPCDGQQSAQTDDVYSGKDDNDL